MNIAKISMMAFLFSFSLCSIGAEAIDDSSKGSVLLHVNGQNVYESDFDKYLKEDLAQKEHKPIADLRAKKIRDVINEQLLKQEIKASNIVVTKEDRDRYIKDGMDKWRLVSEDEYKDKLESLDWKPVSTADEYIDFEVAKRKLIEINWGEKLNLSSEMLESRIAEFNPEVPGEVWLDSLGVIPVKRPIDEAMQTEISQIADKVCLDAKNGMDFYEIFKKYQNLTSCRMYKKNTFVQSFHTSLYKEYEDLEIGYVSEMIQSSLYNGVYDIWKITNKKPRQILTKEDIQKLIEKEYAESVIKNLFKDGMPKYFINKTGRDIVFKDAVFYEKCSPIYKNARLEQ